MNNQPYRPTFEELTKRGRDVVDIYQVARRYVEHVVPEMQDAGQDVTAEQLVHMDSGIKAMLNTVHKHTPIDFGMLLNYPPRTMCHELNQAMEHLSSAGMFKEGFRPDWLA